MVASASYTSDGMQPELHEMIPSITPEMFAGSPIEAAYLEVAPKPEDFPELVEKMKRLDVTPFAWPAEDIRGIEAPTMIVVGDADAVRLEHAVEMFRLLGWRSDGGSGRLFRAPTRGAPRHRPLYPAGQRSPGPRRMAAGDGPPVPRRSHAGGGAGGGERGVTRVLDIADLARGEEVG